MSPQISTARFFQQLTDMFNEWNIILMCTISIIEVSYHALMTDK